MKPVELNPRELLAAFPGGQRKPPFRPRVPRGAAPSDDPADAHSTANQPSPAVAALDAARAADPLSPPVMFAALDSWPGSRGLAALLRVQLALGRFGARPMLRFACAYWPGCLLSVAVWDFGGDRFSQRNLAVGTAASLVFAILGLLPFLTPIVLSYGMRGLGAMATGRAAAPPKPDFNLHAMAGIVRWIQLVGSPEQQQDTPHLASKDFDIETSAPPQHSLVLLAHEDGDSACPCPRPTCAGSLLGASSTFAFLDLSIKMLFAIWLTLLFSWTPLVTLGSQTWRVWWGAVLGVAALLGMFVFIVLNNLVRRITNIRLLALQGRIHRRLLAIALEDLVERSALALSNGNPTESYLPPEPEPYEVLHGLLATAWRTGLEFLAFGRLGYVIFLVVFIISAAIDAIGAGCIPLWTITGFAYISTLFAADIVNVAASNDQIAVATQLMDRARTDLQSLLVRSALRGRGGSPADAAASRHADLLASLAGSSEAHMGTLLGFKVTFGVVRRMLVTIVTVAVALYTVLRGSGQYLTVETMCPG